MPTKQKSLPLVLALLIVAALTLTGCLQKTPVENQNQNLPKTSQNQNVSQPQNSNSAVKTGSQKVSVDDIWQLYTNYDLGFSLKVLKETKSYGKMEIVENNNVVYLITDKGTTYQRLQDNLNSSGSDIEKATGIPWAILIKKVNNDEELEKFLKEKYGEGCQLGEKKSTDQTGVFDIQIKGDGKDLGSTKCPVNFLTVVKYYPAKQVVASWDIGQDYNFAVGDNAVDEEMIESFRFIE